MSDAIQMAPSILSADFTRLAEAIQVVEEAGAEWIHVDVMDGHFVPNLTIGPPVVKALKRVATRPLDVHLMIDNADDTVDWYLEAGADSVTVHVEACADFPEVAARVRDAGAKLGITLNPGTPVEAISESLELVDLVLVMSVHPGFGGQSFILESVDRIARIADMCADLGVAPVIEVDGGIDADTAPLAARAGARMLVAGNAVYGEQDPAAALRAIRAAAEAAIG